MPAFLTLPCPLPLSLAADASPSPLPIHQMLLSGRRLSAIAGGGGGGGSGHATPRTRRWDAWFIFCKKRLKIPSCFAYCHVPAMQPGE